MFGYNYLLSRLTCERTTVVGYKFIKQRKESSSGLSLKLTYKKREREKERVIKWFRQPLPAVAAMLERFVTSLHCFQVRLIVTFPIIVSLFSFRFRWENCVIVRLHQIEVDIYFHNEAIMIVSNGFALIEWFLYIGWHEILLEFGNFSITISTEVENITRSLILCLSLSKNICLNVVSVFINQVYRISEHILMSLLGNQPIWILSFCCSFFFKSWQTVLF